MEPFPPQVWENTRKCFKALNNEGEMFFPIIILWDNGPWDWYFFLVYFISMISILPFLSVARKEENDLERRKKIYHYYRNWLDQSVPDTAQSCQPSLQSLTMILITLGWLTLDTDYRILATGIVLCFWRVVSVLTSINSFILLDKSGL